MKIKSKGLYLIAVSSMATGILLSACSVKKDVSSGISKKDFIEEVKNNDDTMIFSEEDLVDNLCYIAGTEADNKKTMPAGDFTIVSNGRGIISIYTASTGITKDYTIGYKGGVNLSGETLTMEKGDELYVTGTTLTLAVTPVSE